MKAFQSKGFEIMAIRNPVNWVTEWPLVFRILKNLDSDLMAYLPFFESLPDGGPA